MQRLRTEPVITWSAIVGLVNATVFLLVTMDLWNITSEQASAIEIFMVALGAILWPILVAYIPRSQVTPLADPKDKRRVRLIPEDKYYD